MKKMFDIYEHQKERHVHYGISISQNYCFWIYKNEVEGWYKGEDSGAQYPEYGDEIIIEIYDLTPVLNLRIEGVTMKEFIDKMIKDWPPYAGKWYTPRSLHTLYSYLDNYVDTEKIKLTRK